MITVESFVNNVNLENRANSCILMFTTIFCRHFIMLDSFVRIGFLICWSTGGEIGEFRNRIRTSMQWWRCFEHQYDEWSRLNTTKWYSNFGAVETIVSLSTCHRIENPTFILRWIAFVDRSHTHKFGRIQPDKVITYLYICITKEMYKKIDILEKRMEEIFFFSVKRASWNPNANKRESAERNGIFYIILL